MTRLFNPGIVTVINNATVGVADTSFREVYELEHAFAICRANFFQLNPILEGAVFLFPEDHTDPGLQGLDWNFVHLAKGPVRPIVTFS